jgi:hypothetical protein
MGECEMAEHDRNIAFPGTGRQQSDDGSRDEQHGNGRRELLKKLGRYGLYTAPALLAMFATIETAAAS